mgnify:CR=1 FL=1
MAAGFRRLMDANEPNTPSMAIPVVHKNRPPGGGPSIQEKIDDFRARMQKKFDTTTSNEEISHYGNILNGLDDLESKFNIQDEKATILRRGSKAVGEYNKLRDSLPEIEGGVPLVHPKQ